MLRSLTWSCLAKALSPAQILNPSCRARICTATSLKSATACPNVKFASCHSHCVGALTLAMSRDRQNYYVHEEYCQVAGSHRASETPSASPTQDMLTVTTTRQSVWALNSDRMSMLAQCLPY